MNAITKAFEAIDRAVFLPTLSQPISKIDAPVPIGFGQTNSQPSTVHKMLRWLDIEPGHKIMDVGSGSGWTTALLAYLTGQQGHVYAVEILPELVEFGRQNCQRLKIENVSFHLAGQRFGLPAKAPFDRILVSASAKKMPFELLRQLRVGGKMIVPVKNDILEITKESEDKSQVTKHSGYVFVPLIGS
jgi:protein-L-isoaspartate(D-aspartate) O-methyltransferase